MNENGDLERKADIFTKRTIKPHEVVTSVDTASEALALSISEKACVDMHYMAQLSGKSQDELIDELNGVIFLDPTRGNWQTADEYLSGNVRQKLRQAEAAAVDAPGYAPNVEALQQSGLYPGVHGADLQASVQQEEPNSGQLFAQHR